MSTMFATATAFANSFALSSASMPCDGMDPSFEMGLDCLDVNWVDYNCADSEALDSFELDLGSLQDNSECSSDSLGETVLVGGDCCSTTTQPLLGADNGQLEASVVSANQEVDFLEDESMQDLFLGYMAIVPIVSDFSLHYYRNANVADLNDGLVKHIEVFYEGRIAKTSTIPQLSTLLNEVCLKKGPLTRALASPSMSALMLKNMLVGVQTSQARTLLLSLVIYQALSLLDPNVTNAYFLSSQLKEEFGDLWQDPPSAADHDFLTKCMGLFKIVRHVLELDCGGKKGMVIKAATMIADSERTYTNGGSQSNCIQILEAMFHRITDYTVKHRKRSADEMSA